MRFYCISGERSGDLHLGQLIAEIKILLPTSEFRGVGGNYSADAGMQLFTNYNQLAFMGVVEAVLKYNTFKRNFDAIKTDLLAYNPEVVILVDYGGFNLRMAKALRLANIRAKLFYFIPPKIWAWNEKRALKIKALIDKVATTLPFEPSYFKKYGVDAPYVGNPVANVVRNFSRDHTFINQLKNTSAVNVALLPGSRAQELKSLLPYYNRLAAANNELNFLLAAVDNFSLDFYKQYISQPNIKIIFDKTYDLLLASQAAVVASGTATLETALLGVPQIIVYKVNPVTFSLAKMVVKLTHVGLVNIIARRGVVPELLQSQLTDENLNSHLQKTLFDVAYRNQVFAGYAEVKQKLGDQNAYKLAAQYFLN